MFVHQAFALAEAQWAAQIQAAKAESNAKDILIASLEARLKMQETDTVRATDIVFEGAAKDATIESLERLVSEAGHSSFIFLKFIFSP